MNKFKKKIAHTSRHNENSYQMLVRYKLLGQKGNNTCNQK